MVRPGVIQPPYYEVGDGWWLFGTTEIFDKHPLSSEQAYIAWRKAIACDGLILSHQPPRRSANGSKASQGPK